MLNQLVIQLKKEFWLHKNYLLKFPLWFCSALMGIGTVVAIAVYVNNEVGVAANGAHVMAPLDSVAWSFDSGKKEKLAELAQVEHTFSDRVYELNSMSHDIGSNQEMNMVIDLAILFFIVVFLIGGMHSDRSDGSILFWRSLPVSEARNIGVKLLFLLAIIPVIYALWGLVIVTGAGLGISLFGWSSGYVIGFWGPYLLWVQKIACGALFFPLLLLWLLPFISWLMVSAVVAKKRAVLLALTPFALLATVEYLFFQSNDWYKAIYNYAKEGVIFVYELRGGVWYSDPSFPVAGSSVTALTFLLNLLLAGGFIWLSIWLRQKRID